MIRDVVRAVCVIAVMAVGASLLVETRMRLACIEAVARQQQPMPLPPYAVQAPPPPPARLRAVGGAVLNLADPALGVVR